MPARAWSVLLITLPLALGAVPLAAQAGPELMLGARDSTVWLYVPDPPDPNYGFVVYRTGPDGVERRLTEELVRPIDDPAGFAAAVGPELREAVRALDIETRFDLHRRVRSDPFTAHVASLLFRGVARGLARGYLDTAVEPGSTYRYRVVYVDAEDRESGPVRTGEVVATQQTPTPPEALELDGMPHEVVLTWSYPPYEGTQIDPVVSFEVERTGPDGAFRTINSIPIARNDAGALRFVDRSVVPGQGYRYRVRARSMVDLVGPPSPEAEVVARDPRPPGPPPGLTTQAGEGEVALSWRISPDPTVAGYVVERSTGIDQPYQRLNTVPVAALEPMYLDTTAEGTVRYFYRVASVDSLGRVGEPGNGIVAVPEDRTPPAPPTGAVVEVDERQLRIRWEPSPSADVIGYHVYRGETENRMGRITAQPIEATTFFDSGFESEGLRPGQRYQVSITAVDRAYNESDPAPVEAAVPDDEPPLAPRGLVLESHHGRHTIVRWSGSPSLDVSRFTVLRSEPGATEPVAVGSRGIDEPRWLRDTTVVVGTEYEYRLVAVDTAGNESLPAVDTLTLLDPTPPPAPRYAAAVAVAEGVRVEWERVTDPELVGYRVYRATLPTGTFTPVSPLIDGGAERAWVDPEGEPRFFYTVRAVDRSGNTSRPSPAVRGEAP